MDLRQIPGLSWLSLRLLVIVFAACISLACTPIQQTPATPTASTALDDADSCPIVPSVIVDLVQERSSRQSSREAITTRLGIPVVYDPHTGGSHARWTTEEGQSYLLGFVDGRLTRVDLQWDTGRVPTIGEALACLGQPALYNYALEQFQIPYQRLMLWYPESGVILDAWIESHQGVPVDFSLNEPLGLIYVVPADTPIEMATLLYSVPGTGILSEQEIEALVARLKPWPDSIERIELTDCLSEPEICRPH